MKTNPFLQAALFYALRLHWPVFPVKPRSKKPPLTKNGCLDASTDEQQIRAWWQKWPDANVAIRTGVSFWVLDIDPKNGGDISRDRLVARYGPIADTLRQITGGGGWQYFYELPEQAVIQGKAPLYDDWPGIDSRGENNYVIVPPSVHPYGTKYAWDTAKDTILHEPIHPANAWLIEWVLNASRNGQGFQPLPEKIQHGTQHKYLVSEAGKLRDMGLGYEEIVEAIWQTNLKRCEKPGPRANIEQIARSAMKWEPKHALRTKPDEPPGKSKNAQGQSPLPEALSVAEILDLAVPPPEMLIESLLPRRGATLMTGPQKVGKTILAAQVAIALATDHALFDYYALRTHGPVIIVEQDDPAGDASFKDIYVRAQVPREAPIRFHKKVPPGLFLGETFIEWLEGEIRKHAAVAVVLDSYTALRGSRQAHSDLVQEERREITQLDELGKRSDALILVLHHESTTTRSNSTLDWDARGAGTYGLTMAAESQIALARYRDMAINATERLVRVRGRHMADLEMTVRLERQRKLYEWVVEGGVAPLYPLVAEIRRGITQDEFTAKDYEETLGVSRATSFRQLAVLSQAGAVWKTTRGVYRLAPSIAKLNVL